MTSLITTPDHYHAYYQPPPPVTQTLSSVRFTEHSDPEMVALRAMLSAHQTLPYAGRRACGNTKSNTLNNRLAYVEALVDTNALVIETMWYPNTSSSTRQAAVVSLRTFIQEVLKRSRTTYSTLQTALFYLFRSQPAITAHFRQKGGWEGTFINCGRRMFLASLVVASKFVQDKTYRNSAWAKIAGLPVAEINAAERIFLNLVDYRLYISQPTFEQWHHLLHVHVEAKTQQYPLSTLTHPPLFYHQQISWQRYESPTRKRQHTLSPSLSTTSSSTCSTPMPVLTISLPSSNHSSPLHTPTQISPIRSHLWKPTSPKKRKLEVDDSIGQWKHRHLG